MNKNDIILIMSDQHNAHYTSLFKDYSGLTSNLESLKDTSRVFTNAYCNAPLCVPSRMSFMTGKLPSETKVLDNDSILNSDEITLAHKMSLEGYKTILIGRMHFKGHDQFHGFDERYVGDITTQFWGQKRSDLNEFHPGFKAKTCQEVYGTGYSPVLDFDRQVYEKSIEIINRKDDQPRFIVIGFYAPHFPYISEKPSKFKSEITEDDLLRESNVYYSDMVQETTLERVRAMDELYMEMIYEIDEYIGNIHQSVRDVSQESVFIYTSDHGDQLGRRGLFGKKVMYQDSIKIPMLIEGLFKIGTEVSNVSLIDLHHWLVQYANDNKQLEFKQDNNTIVQQVIEHQHNPVWTEAVINEKYKLVKIGDTYELYNISNKEESLSIDHYLQIFEALRQDLKDDEAVSELLEHYTKRKAVNKILKEHGQNINLDFDRKYEIKDKFEMIRDKEFTKGE